MTDELLVKFLLKETNAEEDRQVNEWITADPANAKQMADFQLIWNTSKQLESKSQVDENAAWERFKLKTEQGRLNSRATIRTLIKPTRWLKIAAAILIVSAISLVLFRKSETELTASNKVLTETLPDGSKVTLNKNTSLVYTSQLLGKKRLVKLSRGEVFFKVSPDKSKPFIISSGEVSVEVVGTSFNVKRAGSKTEVIVETGLVKVSEGGETVLLHPGEKVLVDSKNNLRVQKNTDQLYNYYRSKVFIANNTPLWRVVEVLNEAYHVNIVIQRPELRDLTITTTFKDESLSEILKIISETLDISVTQKENTIILQ